MYLKNLKIILTLSILLALWACQREPLPQIIQYDIFPKKLVKGQQAFLQWEIFPSKLTKKLEINGQTLTNNPLELKGSQKIIPQNNQDFELNLYYKQKKQMHVLSQKVSVIVEEPYFRGETNITIGDDAHIEWQVNPDAKDIWMRELIEGKEHLIWENLPPKSSQKVHPIKNTLYELYVATEVDTLKYTHEVKVEHGFFTGSKTVLRGEEGTLIWQVYHNLKDVLLEEKENSYTTVVLQANLNFEGHYKVKPTQTTEYILALVGTYAQTRCRHKMEVVDALFGGQKYAKPNEKAVLTWRVADGAKRIYITQNKDGKQIILKDNLPQEGNLQVLPQDVKNIYTIVAKFHDRESSYQHIITLRDKINFAANKDKEEKTNEINIQVPHLKGVESIESSYAYDIENEPKAVEELEKSVINFDFDSDKIDENYAADLERIVQFLQKHKSAVVEITGHSDLKGSTKGCLRISEKRAKLVKEYLIKRGIPEHRLMLKSAGRTYPIFFQEQTPEQARANRRVEIAVWE
jgi:outer membrane protein OmpA-like peptidoglycan-associated protein